MDEVNRRRSQLSLGLDNRGLKTHEVVEASDLVECLGVEISGRSGEVRPTPTRMRRLRGGILRIINGRPVSGRDLERVLGHITFVLLLNRPLLAVLNHIYAFVERHYQQTLRVWESVRQELEIVLHLLILARCNLKKEWDPCPLMTDASLSGYAVVEGQAFDSATVESMGKWDERWRFRRCVTEAPRVAALSANEVLSDVGTVRPNVEGRLVGAAELDPTFPEIPQMHLHPQLWSLRWSSFFFSNDAIHLKEAHGMLSAVKHVSRNKKRHHRRHLFLSDSMCCVLSLSKWRCVSRALLRICQRVAAECLAANVSITWRWIPSELNVTDEASRRWEHLRRGRCRCIEASRLDEAAAIRATAKDGACASGQAHPCSTDGGPVEAGTCAPSQAVAPAFFAEDCSPSPLSQPAREASGIGESLDRIADLDPGEGFGFRGSPRLEGTAEGETSSATSGSCPGSRPPPRRAEASEDGYCESGSRSHVTVVEEREGQASACSEETAQVPDASASVRGRTRCAGDPVDGGERARLSEEARHALGFHGSLPSGEAANVSLGRRHVRLRRLRVLGGRDLRTRRQAEGSDVSDSSAATPAGPQSASAVQSSPQRLQEGESYIFTGWSPRRRHVRHLCHPLQARSSGDGTFQRGAPLDLCAALGFSHTGYRRRGGSASCINQHECISRAPVGSTREAGANEDWGVRRNGVAGRRAPSHAWGGAGCAPRRAECSCWPGRPGRRRGAVALPTPALSEGTEGRGARARVVSPHQVSLRGTSQRTVSGHSATSSYQGRGDGSRSLDNFGKPAQLREGGTHAKDCSANWRGHSQLPRNHEKEFSHIFPVCCGPGPALQSWQDESGRFRCIPPVTRRLLGRKCLSLFGGEGHLATALTEQGVESLLLDVAHSKRNNIASKRVASTIDSCLLLFDIHGFELPCNTWSRARRAPKESPFPFPLRSNVHLMGLPDSA